MKPLSPRVDPSGLTPIPWRFVDVELTKLWIWQTPHFEAKVVAEVNSYAWELGDLVMSNNGAPRFLAEGRTADFPTAESQLRETIGKSYPSRLGYGAYAGALATTFTLATGERVDLGGFNGRRVVVTVRLPGGATRSFVGQVQVVHYELVLSPVTGGPVRILPGHVLRIAGEGGGTSNPGGHPSYTGIGRIYRGSVPRGCSGRPGFLPDTIDHDGPRCPVHEDAGTTFARASTTV